jgi:SAM-dependent methyltransferase
MRCPVCGSPSRALGFPARARLRQCRECRHRFVDCESFVPEEAYHDGYDGFRRDVTFETRLVDILKTRIRPRVGAEPRLLDVGCGNGVGLRAAREVGFISRGIDISEAAVARCKGEGLDAVVGDFPTFDFGDRAFDVITFWDVLEHLPEPAKFISRAASLLAPGGFLVAKVPAHGAVSVHMVSWLPRLGGAVLQVPHHLQLFHAASLERLLGSSFESPTLFDPGPLRQVSTGGSLRRRLARRTVRAIHRLSGDGGVLAIARRR